MKKLIIMIMVLWSNLGHSIDGFVFIQNNTSVEVYKCRLEYYNSIEATGNKDMGFRCKTNVETVYDLIESNTQITINGISMYCLSDSIHILPEQFKINIDCRARNFSMVDPIIGVESNPLLYFYHDSDEEINTIDFND